MTEDELDAGTAAGRILLGGESEHRLVSAKIVRPRRNRECPTCGCVLKIGEPCWFERWRYDGRIESNYHCLRCDGDEAWLDERNFTVAHLNDFGSCDIYWADELPTGAWPQTVSFRVADAGPYLAALATWGTVVELPRLGADGKPLRGRIEQVEFPTATGKTFRITAVLDESTGNTP